MAATGPAEAAIEGDWRLTGSDGFMDVHLTDKLAVEVYSRDPDNCEKLAFEAMTPDEATCIDLAIADIVQSLATARPRNSPQRTRSTPPRSSSPATSPLVVAVASTFHWISRTTRSSRWSMTASSPRLLPSGSKPLGSSASVHVGDGRHASPRL